MESSETGVSPPHSPSSAPASPALHPCPLQACGFVLKSRLISGRWHKGPGCRPRSLCPQSTAPCKPEPDMSSSSVGLGASPAILGKAPPWNESLPTCVFFPVIDSLSAEPCLLSCIPGAFGGTWIIKTLTFLLHLKREKHSRYKQTRETWGLKTNRLTSGSSAGILKKKWERKGSVS